VLLAIAAGYIVHRRRLLIVSHIKQLEQRNALISERERIARDMHDDLGSRLTHISLLADLTKRTSRQTQSFEKLDELNSAARDATRAVEEIVWSANPGNDTIASLISYMAQYAENILRSAGISCRIESDARWPDVYLSPERRHSVYMVFKEVINNLLKHARAGNVHLELRVRGERIQIVVTDDGVGFDPHGKRESEQDGLANMKERMARIGGVFEIESQPGHGTRVSIRFPWGSAT
jgi:signal transduction histidine kinase